MAGSQKPFCHSFQHEDNWYVYDVSTNSLYKIDEVLAALLPLWGTQSEEAVTERLERRFSAAEVERAKNELRTAQVEDRMFIPCYPEEILSPASRFQTPQPEKRTSITLAVTEQCNLRCRYCPHTVELSGRRPHTDSVMSQETAFAAIDLYDSLTTPVVTDTRISFYGGEALLHFDLIRDTVAYSRTKPKLARSVLSVSTNGLLLNDNDIVRYLIEQGIEVQFSLDGPKEIHDRYRTSASGGGSYDDAVRGLENLLRNDPTAAERIRFIATLGPPEDMLQVAAFYEDFPVFKRLGIDRKPRVDLNVATLRGLDLPEIRQLAMESERNHTAISNYYVRARTAPGGTSVMGAVLQGYDDELRRYHQRERGPMPSTLATTGCCDPLSGRKLFVRASGDLQACEKVAEGFLLGNVRDGLDPAAARKWFEYLHDSIKDRCKTCWALRLCRICFVAFNDSLTWNGPEARPSVRPEYCDNVRLTHEDAFRHYLSIMERDPEALSFLNVVPGNG